MQTTGEWEGGRVVLPVPDLHILVVATDAVIVTVAAWAWGAASGGQAHCTLAAAALQHRLRVHPFPKYIMATST